MAKCCQQYPTANNHSLGLPTSMSFCRSSSSSCPSAVWMPGPAHGAFKGYIEYICSRVVCSKETVSKYYPDLSRTGTPRMIQLKFMTSKVPLHVDHWHSLWSCWTGAAWPNAIFSTEKHGARQQLNLKSGSGEYREININCKIVCIYIIYIHWLFIDWLIHLFNYLYRNDASLRNKGLISWHFSASNFKDCDSKPSSASALSFVQVTLC